MYSKRETRERRQRGMSRKGSKYKITEIDQIKKRDEMR